MSDTTGQQTTGQTSPQWLRKVQLILGASDGSGLAIDEQFRITFSTQQKDSASTFNSCRVRIYNLSEKTTNQVLGLNKGGVEFSSLVLNAGYQPPGQFGTVFVGSIVEFKHGHESNVNTFLDIWAQTGDFMNWLTVSQTLAGPVEQQRIIDALTAKINSVGITNDPNNLVPQTGGVLPRGKVLNGTVMPLYRGLGKQRQSNFTIINGVMTEIPATGWLIGTPIVINSANGMVGFPSATSAGVELTCLLNPKIGVGQLIKINNADINQQTVTAAGRTQFPNTALNLYAAVTNDGIYRVLSHEIEGDSRGNPYYSKLICLAVDPSAAQDSSVSLFGPVAPPSAQPPPLTGPGHPA